MLNTKTLIFCFAQLSPEKPCVANYHTAHFKQPQKLIKGCQCLVCLMNPNIYIHRSLPQPFDADNTNYHH